MQEGGPVRAAAGDRKRGVLNGMGGDERGSALRSEADQPVEPAVKKLITDQAGASDAVADEAPQHRKFP